MNLVLSALSLAVPLALSLLAALKTISLTFLEPNSAKWEDFAEYDRLALKMGVTMSRGNRWGLWRIGGIARTNAFRGQIIFDSKNFPRLSSGARLATAAHELAHLKGHHSIVASLVLLLGAVVSVALVLSDSLVLPTAAWLGSFSLMLYYRRDAEYDADEKAAAFVSPSLMIELLTGIESPRTRYGRLSAGLTHPPPAKRIVRLRRLHPDA